MLNINIERERRDYFKLFKNVSGNKFGQSFIHVDFKCNFYL